MSVVEDKVFEDQIERMKLKNQLILERFQASEEDRKRAESSGATINKNQNVQIRLRNNDQGKQRKKSIPPAIRPKSYNEVSQKKDDNSHTAYNQFNEFHKQGKFNKNNKEIDDEVAYQDYFHFQQTYRSKADHNYSNRRSYHQNNSVLSTDDNYGYKLSARDYQRSTSQNLSKSSPRFSSNTSQNSKLPKSPVDQSVYKLDNIKPSSKDNKPKVNNVKTKNKFKLNSGNIQNVDTSVDKMLNMKLQSPQKKVLDDEYIDDTLEDLEQYRLKVDMEDFTVTNPESTNPILVMPLTSWTNDTILMEPDVATQEDLSTNVNRKVEDGINLVEKSDKDFTNSDASNDNDLKGESCEGSANGIFINNTLVKDISQVNISGR